MYQDLQKLLGCVKIKKIVLNQINKKVMIRQRIEEEKRLKQLYEKNLKQNLQN